MHGMRATSSLCPHRAPRKKVDEHVLWHLRNRPCGIPEYSCLWGKKL